LVWILSDLRTGFSGSWVAGVGLVRLDDWALDWLTGWFSSGFCFLADLFDFAPDVVAVCSAWTLAALRFGGGKGSSAFDLFRLGGGGSGSSALARLRDPDGFGSWRELDRVIRGASGAADAWGARLTRAGAVAEMGRLAVTAEVVAADRFARTAGTWLAETDRVGFGGALEALESSGEAGLAAGEGDRVRATVGR
jgi:hypothetical protein